jgi:hypothetical protein
MNINTWLILAIEYVGTAHALKILRNMYVTRTVLSASCVFPIDVFNKSNIPSYLLGIK